MKKLLSLIIVVLIVFGTSFAVPYTAATVDKSQTSVDESLINIYVDVSAVLNSEDTFWAYIWDDSGKGRWEPIVESEVGYRIVRMRMNEGAVFTRINSGQEPGWMTANYQTRDLYFTGYNCAILSYSTNSGIMDVEWKYVEHSDKRELLRAMREAEKFLDDEEGTYTEKSIANLVQCYLEAQECYKKLIGQIETDRVAYFLRDAIFSLELIKGYEDVDKNQLSYAISTAISYYMSLDTFTGYSWNYMLDKVDEAEIARRNERAPQGAVDFAAQELLVAIDSLERVESSRVVGDVDGDYSVSVVDATLIQRYLAQDYTIDKARFRYADAYIDGKITILDATQIQRFLAQIIELL